MSGFIVVPPRDYVAELLRVAGRFSASVEYQSLDAQERRCAGLVFAAFSRFCEASLADRQAADECSTAIEHFASMSDVQAQNIIVTEVFEGFRHPERSVGLLLPLSRALYERWIGPIYWDRRKGVRNHY
jgi:hypothetical protein